MDSPFLLYCFSSGIVFYLPFSHFGSESRRIYGIGLAYTRNYFTAVDVRCNYVASMPISTANLFVQVEVVAVYHVLSPLVALFWCKMWHL